MYIEDRLKEIEITLAEIKSVLMGEEQIPATDHIVQELINELCLKCGRYQEEHNGACDGCKWLGIKRGREV